MMIRKFLVLFLQLIIVQFAMSQNNAETNHTNWAAHIAGSYYMTNDVVYRKTADYELTLDLFIPRNLSGAESVPTVLMIHGGGWMGGNKNKVVLDLLPYLQMGWAAVNIEYHAGKGTAPVAVSDCRCALRWLMNNAEKYFLDENKIVITGSSAGGHLALATGMLPEISFPEECRGEKPIDVAAIVNWNGSSNVVELLDGPYQMQFATEWFSNVKDKMAIAQQISPLYHVRKDGPPVFTIHGDNDNVFRYAQAVEFHQKLDQAGIENRLFTVRGGGHGGFDIQHASMAYHEVFEFLNEIFLKQ